MEWVLTTAIAAGTNGMPDLCEPKPIYININLFSSSGRVSASVYRKYFRAGGSWCLLIVTILSIIMAQVITSASDLWLTHWYTIIYQAII
jgi:hypothetical protein